MEKWNVKNRIFFGTKKKKEKLQTIPGFHELSEDLSCLGFKNY